MKKTNYHSFELLCFLLADRNNESGGKECSESEIKNIKWEEIFRLADKYLVAPALYLGLKQKGCLELMDTDAREFLEAIHELNWVRNRRLRDEGLGVIRLLNTKNIKPVLLKGIAGLLSGLYLDDGERIMGDIDLLVDKSDLIAVLKLLLEHGYQCNKKVCEQVFEDRFWKHELTILSKSGLVNIDLHVRPTGPSGSKAFISTDEAIAGGEVIQVDGASAILPSPLFRLMHNFYHAQHLDHSYYIYGKINLRQLIDWVRLWRQYGSEVDNVEVASKIKLHRKTKSFNLYAMNAEKWLNLAKPQDNKIGWVDKALFYRQILQIQHPWFYSLNRFSTLFIKTTQLFSSERLCLEFGDMPMEKLIGLRVAKLFDLQWYKYRIRGFKSSWGRKNT